MKIYKLLYCILVCSLGLRIKSFRVTAKRTEPDAPWFTRF